MKKFTLIFSAVCILSNAVCQDKGNVKKENDAIVKVLLEEGKLFSENDLDGVMALYITDMTTTNYDGVKVYSGWNDIKALYDSYIELENKANPVENYINDKKNVIIKVTGDNAWVICDNIWKWDLDGHSYSNTNKQIAFLEKIDGKWKFAFNSYISIPEQ